MRWRWPDAATSVKDFWEVTRLIVRWSLTPAFGANNKRHRRPDRRTDVDLRVAVPAVDAKVAKCAQLDTKFESDEGGKRQSV